jgi:hypothetical protein
MHERERDGRGPSARRGASFDRWTLGGMAVGVAILLQPWWRDGFRVGFFVTLAATLAQIVASHLSNAERA